MPVRITDPDDLTAAERRIADQYAGMSPGDFDLVVAQLLGNPSDELQRVLYSSDLAQETTLSLGRLSALTQTAASQAPKRSARRGELVARVKQIGALRSELRPFVNLAAAAAANKGPRHHAERVLGQVRYGELKLIIADLEAGLDERQAAQRHRERLADDGVTATWRMPATR